MRIGLTRSNTYNREITGKHTTTYIDPIVVILNINDMKEEKKDTRADPRNRFNLFDSYIYIYIYIYHNKNV